MSDQAHRRVAFLISGSGSNMEALARSMTDDHPCRPVIVVSDVRGAGGLARADTLGINNSVVARPAYASRADFEEALHRLLLTARPDILCLAGFMRVLSPVFVGLWAGRMLNIHPSLLPKYPGLHTHARALVAGDADHGATVHEVTADLDAGPILGQVRMPVLPGDTEGSLAARLLPLEHRLYAASLARFATGDRRRLDL